MTCSDGFIVGSISPVAADCPTYNHVMWTWCMVTNIALIVAKHSPRKATTSTILVLPYALMMNPKLDPTIT